MKEFFEKMVIVLDKFAERTRLYEEKIAFQNRQCHQSPLHLNSNSKKRLHEETETKRDDKNLISKNILCEENLNQESTNLNTLEVVDKDKISGSKETKQNSRTKLKKSYSLLDTENYVGYSSCLI